MKDPWVFHNVKNGTIMIRSDVFNVLAVLAVFLAFVVPIGALLWVLL